MSESFEETLNKFKEQLKEEQREPHGILFEEWDGEAAEFWDEFTNAWYYLPDPPYIPESLNPHQFEKVRNELKEMKELLEKTIAFIENKLTTMEKTNDSQ